MISRLLGIPHMHFALIALCTLFFSDWPQFRGPNSDGHSSEPKTPMEWSDTKNVAWKVSVPGLGWSSPAIADGKVFLTTAVPHGEGLSLRVLAVDAESGKTIWDREFRAIERTPSIHTKNSHASPTPIIHDRSVFVHFGALGMARLSAADGALQWMNSELEYSPLHGSGGSPVLYDGKLFIACDGTSKPFVAAIDVKTGKVAWKTPRSVEARISHSFGTAAVTVVDGKAQLLAPGPNHLAVYDLETGAELCKVLAPGWSVVPQPAIGHGMVFYNHDYDNPELMAVRLGGVGDVTDTHVAWRINRGAPSTPSPLLVDEELYFVSDAGIASCVDAKTGERHWMERLDGNFSASPVFANRHVLFLNETGEATWIQTGKEFTILGKNTVPGRTFATPAFADGAMYLRTDETLYKFAE
jgi:outer membrane protein assembly factor BamB